jgi:chromosomal replication initiation ATPase DnaA
VPVVIVGEETIVQQLSHLRRFTSRIAQEVEFQPLDMEDTALVAQQLCEVEVREDLLAKIHAETRGNCRNTVVALGRIEQHARAGGSRVIDLAAWTRSKTQLFTGEASPRGH